MSLEAHAGLPSPPQLQYVACTIAPIVARQAPPKAMAAIVDFDERTLAFKAVAAAFCHTGIIAKWGVGFGRRRWR
jgi:hypothetical protein